MRRGTLAFIDVLGFKGIWKIHDSNDILESLEKIRSRAQQLVQMWPSDGGDLWSDLEIEVRLFSDTIVIYSFLPQRRDDLPESYEATRRYMHLRYIVLTLTYVLAEAIQGKIPFPYRGCITTGEFDGNDFALLGPAVDEAGRLFEAAEGAFVFLTSPAAEIYRSRTGWLSFASLPYFVPYDVPLKESKMLDTFVLNPFLFVKLEKRKEIRSRILSMFEPGTDISEDVALKRDNHTTRQKILAGRSVGVGIVETLLFSRPS